LKNLDLDVDLVHRENEVLALLHDPVNPGPLWAINRSLKEFVSAKNASRDFPF